MQVHAFHLVLGQRALPGVAYVYVLGATENAGVENAARYGKDGKCGSKPLVFNLTKLLALSSFVTRSTTAISLRFKCVLLSKSDT